MIYRRLNAISNYYITTSIFTVYIGKIVYATTVVLKMTHRL